jgi:hypothetical protein
MKSKQLQQQKLYGSRSNTLTKEEFWLLGYNAIRVQCVESQSTFRKKIKAGSACCLLHAGVLLVIFFDPEQEGDMILRNAD